MNTLYPQTCVIAIIDRVTQPAETTNILITVTDGTSGSHLEYRPPPESTAAEDDQEYAEL